MNKRTSTCIIIIFLSLYASNAPAAGLNTTIPALPAITAGPAIPAGQMAAVVQNTQGTITAAKSQELRNKYIMTKKTYDQAKIAAAGTYTPTDLRVLAEKYNLAYRQYVEATQMKIRN